MKNNVNPIRPKLSIEEYTYGPLMVLETDEGFIVGKKLRHVSGRSQLVSMSKAYDTREAAEHAKILLNRR